jgi:hypothetical protein
MSADYERVLRRLGDNGNEIIPAACTNVGRQFRLSEIALTRFEEVALHYPVESLAVVDDEQFAPEDRTAYWYKKAAVLMEYLTARLVGSRELLHPQQYFNLLNARARTFILFLGEEATREYVIDSEPEHHYWGGVLSNAIEQELSRLQDSRLKRSKRWRK